MTVNLRTWSYASLLAGGLLIVVVALAGAAAMGLGATVTPWSVLVENGVPSYVTPAWFVALAWWMGAVGIVTGAMVLYGAWRLRRHPEDALAAGTLGIVGGALSLLAMGGWMIGAALAIAGGALALVSERETVPGPRAS
jgi:hypothetical protein